MHSPRLSTLCSADFTAHAALGGVDFDVKCVIRIREVRAESAQIPVLKVEYRSSMF